MYRYKVWETGWTLNVTDALFFLKSNLKNHKKQKVLIHNDNKNLKDVETKV